MRENRQQMHWNSGVTQLRLLETWCLHNYHSKWKLTLFLVNQVTAQSHLQVSSACGLRLCELFVTGLWSLLYKAALGCCCGQCCAMVTTHCHVICSVKLILSLSSMLLPISLACVAKISKFQKEWINHLERRAGKYGVISPTQQPQREGGAVSCQTGQGILPAGAWLAIVSDR